MRLDAVSGTALLDMYANCGNVERALDVFSDIEERTLVHGTLLSQILPFMVKAKKH